MDQSDQAESRGAEVPSTGNLCPLKDLPNVEWLARSGKVVASCGETFVPLREACACAHDSDRTQGRGAVVEVEGEDRRLAQESRAALGAVGLEHAVAIAIGDDRLARAESGTGSVAAPGLGALRVLVEEALRRHLLNDQRLDQSADGLDETGWTQTLLRSALVARPSSAPAGRRPH
jgi:hypothetical protein